MRIYTRAGDLAFKQFTFPDGQPHFQLETEDEPGQVWIESAIRSFNELAEILLANDVLRHLGYGVNLDIRYLLGARMDRALDAWQPFTLQTVARLINGAGFDQVRILDAHSEVATRLIRHSVNVLPYAAVNQARKADKYPFIVCPDKGAHDRVTKLCAGYHIKGSKVRDVATGKLTSFAVESLTKMESALEEPRTYMPVSVMIVDDICDGGGTFVGLAKELRKEGAQYISLFVTHGIFSKGLPLEGIDHVYTTDSYRSAKAGFDGYLGSPQLYNDMVTVIPVSMKDMK